MDKELERSGGSQIGHPGDLIPLAPAVNLVEIGDTCIEPSANFENDCGISRICQEVSYAEFFCQYLVRNSPCIISNFVSNDWESRKLWREGLKPSWSSLREQFGDAEVPVANCNEKEYNSQKKSTFTLNKYLDYLEQHIENGHQSSDPNLYLKDWHLTRDYPAAAVYRVPNYFASDWLNEYFCQRTDVHDDYRFVYIGPKGSWTPLHADVFTSFSWSVNIVGRKRWVLFPPGEEAHLKDRFGNLAYDIFSEEIHDLTKYPHCKKPGKLYDIIQEAGEAIFVPSGWHHQVWNLEDTISINHNWINGCNIRQIWIALSSCLLAVQKEVNDCSDMDGWHSHCQVMLRATHVLSI
ncbi:2-oxoglutarate and iron-dependent oxygenase JMJD4 isoform X2 [Thrips palmi]|uniref:2-oxoglutarate and iron-dependent oxygenase JMJD4 n=1 Tax=Thrips palmi TaxID=161013 RepID=A0A6P8ZLE2_THRPL|nr:2-oxoglutarate and iron-dependent oxygenase JMJD4 isoform X2 [Thrips palmi]